MALEPEQPLEAADVIARVDPRWDAARTEHALAGLARRRGRRRARAAIGTLAAIAAGIALAVATWPRGAPVAGAPVADAAPSPAAIVLADGSTLRPGPDGVVVVEEVSEARIVARLDAGSVRADVVPRPSRAFEVRVGAVTVSVLGTVFEVTRVADERARVAVVRGRVRVSWAAGEVVLEAGESGVYPDEPRALAASEPGAPSARAEIATAVPAPEPLVESPRAAPSRVERARAEGAPGWRDLARDGRYEEAYDALRVAPSADAPDRVDDLLLAADAARLSGHAADALPFLDRVIAEHGTDDRAVLAVFTRGRVRLGLGRAAGAADDFERALALEPRGSLAEDALARAALARATAGEHERALALAARYRAERPGGRWSARLEALERAPE